MIAEIDFGKEEEGDSAFVRRAGHQHLRVLAFHINNEAAANKCYYTRLRLRQMLLDVARYQVDYMGGDANQAIFRFFQNQPSASISDSSFHLYLRRLVKVINENIVEEKHKVTYSMVTSNSQLQLDEYDEKYALSPPPKDDLQMDCMVGVLLGYGHGGLREFRETKMAGTPDYNIRVAEFFFNLGNRTLWLGPDDGDWHSPLTLVVRPHEVKNKRKRSDEKMRLRWAKYQVRQQEPWKEKDTAATTAEPPWKRDAPWKTSEPPWRTQRWNQWWDSSGWSSRSAQWYQTASESSWQSAPATERATSSGANTESTGRSAPPAEPDPQTGDVGDDVSMPDLEDMEDDLGDLSDIEDTFLQRLALDVTEDAQSNASSGVSPPAKKPCVQRGSLDTMD
jgi:hypothetical protein